MMEARNLRREMSRARRCDAVAYAGALLVAGIVIAGLSMTAVAVPGDLVKEDPERWHAVEKVISPGGAKTLRTAKVDLNVEGGGVGYQLPHAADNAYVCYMLTDYQDSLAGMKVTATVRVSVQSEDLPVFTYYNPDNTVGGRSADVRLFFQDMIGGWECYDYWWSTSGQTPMGNIVEVSCTLTAVFLPQYWTDIYGHAGTLDASHLAAFNDALDGVKEIGLSFGGGYFYACGVGLESGDAMFIVDSYLIEPAETA